MKSQNAASGGGLVISPQRLRQAIGINSIALPFALVFGKWLIDGGGIQTSMSAYYYTSMRGVFVGNLFVTGAFLLSYRGYERADRLAGSLACVFVVGIALFPTLPPTGATATQTLVGRVHLILALAYFLTLAYFSLVLFRRTDPTKPMTGRKRQRNVVYALCGYTILLCLVLVAIDFVFLKRSTLQLVHPVLWLESVAVMAIGISWLTKGGAILADVGTTERG